MTDRSNRPKPPTAAAVRESCKRAIAELDRVMALPVGHPDTLRMFANGRGRVIVPSHMTQAQVDELVELGREGLEAELEQGLGEDES